MPEDQELWADPVAQQLEPVNSWSELPERSGTFWNSTTMGPTTNYSSRRIAALVDMKHLFISPNEIQVKEKIGSGGSGVVHRGVWHGTDVAVKTLFICSQGEIDAQEMEMLRHEAAVFASLRHPNVALFLGACLERPSCFLVTQLYRHGSLQDLLENAKPNEIDWEFKTRLAGDAARGLNYLHTFNPPIIHRDVKSSNILIDDSFRARITDFGLTNHQILSQRDGSVSSDMLTTDVGTLRWTAPELIQASRAGENYKAYGASVDVYSFGIVLWEIAMRRLPYSQVKYNLQVEKDVVDGKRPTSYPGCSPPGKLYWHPFGTPWTILMEECWSQNPSDRPSMEAVVERLERIALSSARAGRSIEEPTARNRMTRTPSPPPSRITRTPSPPTSRSTRTPPTCRTPSPPGPALTPVEAAVSSCSTSSFDRDPAPIMDSQKSLALTETQLLHADLAALQSEREELRMVLNTTESENFYLRQRLREYESSARLTLQQYTKQQMAKSQASTRGPNPNPQLIVQQLRAQLEETLEELHRVTELCRSANQEVATCNAEIISLKRRVRKQARRNTAGSANSSASTRHKMIP
eukprot:TRINITY_DN6691_c0_g1_i2.p1 TRINITY_DN6691_c0_g1~~TRINITY_DN6691_c0_g1_i2.p1  ORF type:complete len:581 (-),score=76.30 TRINITY_DN6691_c0_g1_i2:314-2056(-)